MKKKFGVLFDLDGTLLDTEKLIFAAFRYVFTKYKPNYVLTEKELYSFFGPSLQDTFGRYFNTDEIEEIIASYREYSDQHHKEDVTIFPTVRQTLEILQSLGYPLAVVTNKAKRTTMLGLEQFHLVPFFDAIITLQDVRQTKPDPEGVYLAMQQLQVKQALMIGDNGSDIEAAKKAGIYSAGMEWSGSEHRNIALWQPDIMLHNSMEEIITFVNKIGGKRHV